MAKTTNYTVKDWDVAPFDRTFFDEFLRISKHAIIWGANHFISKLPYDSPCWLVWNKENGTNDFADCELAWTNFPTSVRKFDFRWNGMLQGYMKNKETRIHPTQKPIALYSWILDTYANGGGKIFDPCVGSGSSRIACFAKGFDFYGCELDKEYYDLQEKRFKEYKQQLVLF